ncbi:MAG: penicillin-binding transpeptidase domain-containing protein, partial [Chloroflexi bacterium]|nr:penicillin-binding transpeptidase domain-containing protein [Chloroflexota bacterium]
KSCTEMPSAKRLVGTSAIANGGTLYQPQVVRQVLDSNGSVVRDFMPKVAAKVPVSPENLATVREGMKEAVSQTGTAYRLDYPDLSIAGKTGTAEYGPRDANGNRRSHAWFTGFAPFDDPQIAVVVMIAGGGEGSTYAVPVAGEILRAFFHLPPAK